MEAELIMMGLSSICSFLAAYTMYKIQKREKLEEERRKARDQEHKQKEKAREQWTIVNKKDTIFKYIFWERLDSLPIPECCFHFVWCQIA